MVKSNIGSNGGYSFGTSTRRLPMEGKTVSPGPVHTIKSSFGNKPGFSFGGAKRFC